MIRVPFRSEALLSRSCSLHSPPLMTKATFLVALFVWTLPGLGDGDTSPQADLASDLATRFWFTPGCIAIVPISIRAIETSTRRLRSKACTT